MLLTVDSSVIIASLLEKEEKHQECKRLMNKISNAEHTTVAPYSVFVEVVAAIKRRTKSSELAERIGNDLQLMETIHFLELTGLRVNEAANIAKKTGLRGMDAIVVQVAKETNTALVTLDDEMARKSKNLVRVLSVED